MLYLLCETNELTSLPLTTSWVPPQFPSSSPCSFFLSFDFTLADRKPFWSEHLSELRGCSVDTEQSRCSCLQTLLFCTYPPYQQNVDSSPQYGSAGLFSPAIQLSSTYLGPTSVRRSFSTQKEFTYSGIYSLYWEVGMLRHSSCNTEHTTNPRGR